MTTVDARQHGVNILNALLEQDDLPSNVRDGIYNALIIVDPQQEESELVDSAIQYALETASQPGIEMAGIGE